MGFRSPAPKARPEEGGPSYPSRTLGPFPRQTCNSPADLKRQADCQYGPGAHKSASELFSSGSAYPEIFGGFFPAVSRDFIAYLRALIQAA